jgi:hypothetical protein
MFKKIALTLLLTFSFSGFVKADPYIGAGYIYTNYKDNISYDDLDIKDDSSGYTIYGGYEFAALFAVELGYADFVDTNSPVDNTKIYADAWLASGKISLPLTIFDIYGRVGMGHFSTNIKSSNNVYGGVGAGVSLGPVRLALEYTVYDNKLLQDSIGLNAEFHF